MMFEIFSFNLLVMIIKKLQIEGLACLLYDNVQTIGIQPIVKDYNECSYVKDLY